MFELKENPAYENLSQDATTLIVGWVEKDWYESSVEVLGELEEAAP